MGQQPPNLPGIDVFPSDYLQHHAIVFIFSYKYTIQRASSIRATASAPHLPSRLLFFAPQAATPVIKRNPLPKYALMPGAILQRNPPGILRLVLGAYWANRAEATWIAAPIRHKGDLLGSLSRSLSSVRVFVDLLQQLPQRLIITQELVPDGLPRSPTPCR